MTHRTARRKTPRRAALANRADATFRAFSDATRLRILHLLEAGELCVGDIVKVIRVPQPTASRHLAYLRRTGLVASRKDGIWTYYTLASPQNPFHQKLLECLTHCFSEVREFKADVARAASLRERGGCCPK